uniref:Uncharacterized protein n=1 Tax=Coccolithus braarudii TaxID=221442 RepID=A0A7S0L709_9EUKA
MLCLYTAEAAFLPPVQAAGTQRATPRAREVFLGFSNKLFDDLQGASSRAAEKERLLLEPNSRPMRPPSEKRANSGRGFGAGASSKNANKGARKRPRKADSKDTGASNNGKVTEAENYVHALHELRKRTLTESGVVMLPQALAGETARALREEVIEEIAEAREAVRHDPAVSTSRFHVPVEQPTRAFTLLPFLRTRSDSVDPPTAAPPNGPILRAVQELLGPRAPLGKLFGSMCDGDDSVLYDFYALRTEPGSLRQQIHSDTPHQKVPPLFAAFIALQDVSIEMGPTVFLPGTHTRTSQRLQFDHGVYNGGRDEMLAAAKSEYGLLKSGDLVLFDMRTLHAGNANLVDGGSTRYFLCITFRNTKANAVDLGHVPCIRPGFVDKFTLGDIHEQLELSAPFSFVGDGLPVSPAIV